MKIAFYLDDNSNVNGGARPIINWAHLAPDDSILITSSRLNYIEGIYNHKIENSSLRISELIKGFDFLVVSDHNLRKGTLLARKSGVKLIVYCQVPFGLHALGVKGNNELRIYNFVNKIIKLVPFKLMTHMYVKRLSNADGVIANSLSISILLNYVYGVIPIEIVYPPVDDLRFQQNDKIIKDSILIFVGRTGDLNEYGSLPILAQISKEKNILIKIFGTAPIPNQFLTELPEVEIYNNLSDEELISLYNRSFVTVSIQKQEYFGYVPIESVLCGTPAITFYKHDAIMISSCDHFGITQSNLKSLRKDVTSVIESYRTHGKKIDRNSVVMRFSAMSSFKKLVETLESL